MQTPGETQDSLLGPTVVIRGELTARQERLTIMGTVEGTIDHDQSLTIHRDGNVEGEIRAQEVIVEGTVEGDIHGIKRVRIAKTGRVTGNVYSQRFSVDEGARIKGSVIMDADAEAIEQRFQSQTQPARDALPAKKTETRNEATESPEVTRDGGKHADESIGGADNAKTTG